jgi:S-DNA-T family DNA segregation ATPase FtsK/SpoIIIE
MVLDVPICVAMRDVGVLGICGPRALRTGVLRSLVIQATTLHSPEQLHLVILAPGASEEWSWARWLPHLASRPTDGGTAAVGFDEAQVNARVSELNARHSPPDGGDRPHTLVIVDGTAAIRGCAALATLTSRAGADSSVIWCDEDERDLPGAATAIAVLSAAPQPALMLRRSGHDGLLSVVPDLMAVDVAEAAARTLAPLRDSTGGGQNGLPTSLRWEDVADVDLGSRQTATRSVTRHWSRGPSTAITLGSCGDEPTTIDLCRDGPHTLIAGTTGSGKSELLLSMVASLAAKNRPDQLSLLLIDHKGGAAFGPCARLPHTVGVVTDLDRESTKRALLSLTAELRRREALFAAVDATDLESYAAATAGEGRPTTGLARLVIMVDEFATLAEEQPEFVGGLVGIAQRGRSLGVHLVLATQRPDGVVSADIRANARLRICLGVARESESRDVIDCPDAVTISRTTPGRAYLRIGPGDLTEFQTARVGGRRADEVAATVTLSPTATLGEPPVVTAPSASVDVAADLDVLIDAAIEVSETLGATTPPPPWLPALPLMLPQSTLPRRPDPTTAAWGLLDLPAAGAQRPLTLDLSVGATTVLAGVARSGRTTAARAIALAAASQLAPERLNLWAIDASAGLADLARLAHCGAVIPATDLDRTDRLLSHLMQEIGRRRQNPGDDWPALMLIVDSWEGLAAATEDRAAARMVDTLIRLATDGPAAQLHTVITTDRGGLIGRIGGMASEKIALRLSDPGDYSLIGLPARDAPRQPPAGRGVRASDLALLQVALPDEAVATAARRWPSPRQPVRRFDPLPTRVCLSELSLTAAEVADHVLLGVGADDLAPRRIARADIGSSFMIAGNAGSGRSSALLLLARQLRGRRLAISCLHGSPLADRLDAVHLPRDDQDHAADLLQSLCSGGGPAPDVLVDDIDLLAEGPLSALLADLIRSPADREQVIAFSGSLEAMTTAFRGPIAAGRRAKTGLLLCPTSAHDGDVLGVRLPRHLSTDDPPGRGWLASRGTATRLQLADPSLPSLDRVPQKQLR